MAKKKKRGNQTKRGGGGGGALMGMRSGMKNVAGGKKGHKKEASFGQVMGAVLAVFLVVGLIAYFIR